MNSRELLTKIGLEHGHTEEEMKQRLLELDAAAPAMVANTCVEIPAGALEEMTRYFTGIIEQDPEICAEAMRMRAIAEREERKKSRAN